MKKKPTAVESRHERWPIVRDVLVFQFKLLVDGFRDLLLLPVSLLVGIVSVIGKGKGSPPGDEFYDLLHAARRTERWINLFGAAENRRSNRAAAGDPPPAAAMPDLDALVTRIETFLVDEYRKGGVTAQAKARLDTALESLREARHRIGRPRKDDILKDHPQVHETSGAREPDAARDG